VEVGVSVESLLWRLERDLVVACIGERKSLRSSLCKLGARPEALSSWLSVMLGKARGNMSQLEF